MITVYIKKIEPLSAIEKQNIINSLSHCAKERLNKKRNEKLYLASLCALSLLTNEQRNNLKYTENGRPFLDKLNQDISISHSKNYVAVAISNSRSIHVGVDVEDTSDVNISNRFFTENEKKIVTDNQKFIEIWTKKEALFKFLKNDSLNLIQLDSTAPKQYGATFLSTKIENSILTICTQENAEIEIKEK